MKQHYLFIIGLSCLLFASAAFSSKTLESSVGVTCENLTQYYRLAGEKRISGGITFSKQDGKNISNSSLLDQETGLITQTNTFLAKKGGKLTLGIFPKNSQILLCTMDFQCGCDDPSICIQKIEVVEYNCNLVSGNGSSSDPYLIELGKVGSK
ncbi:hypothetical protein BH10PSE19_BH10PSE19_12380 [soil metagenome]